MQITRRAAIISVSLSGAIFAQQSAPERYPEAPYVPTPIEVVEGMLKLAGVHAGDVVYDLGSGDGRIVIMAAQKFGARGVGVELDADLIRDAREHAQKAGVAGRTRFIEGDLFDADLRPASVVTLYLVPKMLPRLKPKLLQQLKPGSRIVAFAFAFPDWPPSKTGDVNGRHIYLWEVADSPK